jgi:predicted molibdopterin-dependent oxidoreductase YjgC
MNTRVKNHVVLGEKKDEKFVEITVDGKKIKAVEGEKILAALLAEGIIVNRYTVKKNEPRGLFCGIGQCTDCAMVVNGKPNVRTCVTPVKEGMVIETQKGLGKRGEIDDK